MGLPVSDYDKELKSKKHGHRLVHRGCSMQAIKSKEISCGHVDKNPTRFFIGKFSFFKYKVWNIKRTKNVYV